MQIRYKASFIIVVLTILPLAFTFLINIPTTQQYETQDVLEHLESVAQIHEDRVVEILGDYHQEIDLLAQLHVLHLYEAYMENSSIDFQALAYPEINNIKDIVQSIDNIEVANTTGTILAATNVTRINENISEEDFFTRSLTGHVIDAFYLDWNQTLKLHLAGPIIVNGTVVAVTVICYNPTDMIDLFSDFTGLGESGEALLAKRDQNGDALFITPLRHLNHTSLNFTLSKDNETAPITQALLGNEDSFTTGLDYIGNPVLASTRYIEEVDWGIVVKIDVIEAFSPLYITINTIILTSIISTILLLTIGIFVASSITRPIAKLSKVATLISEGELTQRANIDSGDEIEDLATTINTMADTLVNSNIELEKRVERRTIMLSRSNEALEQFAYVISHDLQEPLRMVVSYLQLIVDRYQDQLDEDANTFIDFAVDGAKRMREMIIDLLQFSRAGRQSLAEEKVDCNEIVVEVLTNLKVAISESGTTVDTKHLPSVMANRGGITALFQNLIANSIKYRSEDPPRIVIKAVEKDNEWQFSLVDNGIGIDVEHHSRIFDVFQKLHPRKLYPGTGIGLAVCKRVIDGLGGRIWVESKLNEGATFYFTIPRRRITK